MDSAREGGANAAQKDYWSRDVGGEWVALQDRLEAVHAPFTEVLVEAVGPRPGDHALDIGCGTGGVSRRLAGVLGTRGAVTGLDIAPVMLDAARAAPVAEGAAPITWREADAQIHPFDPASFDLAVSRMGVMFFADPVAAFANIRRALRPGGRFAAIAWRRGADNPWFGIAAKAVAEVADPGPPSDPYAPGPMAFAEEGRVTEMLSQAGWTEARADRVAVELRPGGGAAEVAGLMARIGPAARALRLAGHEAGLRTRIVAALTKRLSAFETGGQVRIPVRMNLFTARA